MASVSRTLAVVAAASAAGAPRRGPEQGPGALLGAGLTQALQDAGCAMAGTTLLEAQDAPACGTPMHQRLQACADYARRLAERIATLPAAHTALVIGGDHAVAAGSWRGVGVRQGDGGAPGLLWIDAHLDSHTDATTHSGNIHGMPLAALLGEGAAALTGLRGPALDPARTCVLGARAWEGEERALLQRLGVRIFEMAEIRRRGLDAVFAEALRIARGKGGGFGVSLDLDAIDPQQMPAVLCPEAGGIDAGELATALRTLRGCADLRALEITEYVPALDPDGGCARLVIDLACAALGRRSG
ncbi:arginase family protein [Pseudothauera lacus]|uniref:arginase family protein n=1 Tax=Pseudothauera lacus TaxID=2136175 RepID=UPI0015E6559F|nr:arginase family protein [Pseudothauera lacus]